VISFLDEVAAPTPAPGGGAVAATRIDLDEHGEIVGLS